MNTPLFEHYATMHHRSQVHRQRLLGTLARVHPGSAAQSRVNAELKATEIDAGLWEGRMEDLKEPANV